MLCDHLLINILAVLLTAPLHSLVGGEPIDSPPTVTCGPPEKTPFVVVDVEEVHLIPDSASQDFLFRGMFEDINVAAGFQGYLSEVKGSQVMH